MSSFELYALTFVVFVSLCGFAVIAWGAWSGFWAIYDHIMQGHKRINNRRIDATVGRDVYRFVKGVHR